MTILVDHSRFIIFYLLKYDDEEFDRIREVSSVKYTFKNALNELCSLNTLGRTACNTLEKNKQGWIMLQRIHQKRMNGKSSSKTCQNLF